MAKETYQQYFNRNMEKARSETDTVAWRQKSVREKVEKRVAYNWGRMKSNGGSGG